MKKKWMGSWPTECDFCETDLRQNEHFFVDGATRFGPWALMCESCFPKHGVGVGPGRGQKYNAKTREKIEG